MIKHFIDINSYKKKELREILLFAKKIKKNPNKYSNLLKSKTLGMLFEKQSTRTRLSFNIGIQKLGGYVLELDKKAIGFGSRESDKDIIKVMSQYLDCLMIRNNNHKNISKLASYNILPIINGLSDSSHPCQILSDIFTIEEKKGKIENLNICWIGDYNNVLVSLIQAAEIFKFKLKIACPKLILVFKRKEIKKVKSEYISFFSDIKKAVNGSDCIMTDVWISMGEKRKENKKKIFKNYKVTNQVLKFANKKAIFMHCLPAHRNEEVTDEVIDGKQSIIWEQAKNRMFVQQSILNFLIKN